MTLLAGLAAGGWLTGFALVVLIVETLVLLRLRPAMPRGLILPNALAGASLIGALHAVLVGWGLVPALALLAIALGAHVADLLARLESAPRRP